MNSVIMVIIIIVITINVIVDVICCWIGQQFLFFVDYEKLCNFAYFKIQS